MRVHQMSRLAIAQRMAIFPLAAAWLVAVWLVASAQPQGALADEPARSDLEVHDLSLWILEPGSSQANSRGTHSSALPSSVQSSRKLPADSKASLGPVNVLTFYGRPATGLDVDLRTKSGTFLAHWPPGEGLPNRLRWSGMPSYDLVEKVDNDAELTFVETDHWMHAARQGDALFVKHGARSERFLAYDVEANLGAPLKLEGGPDEFKVINASGSAVYDVLISRPTPEGRRLAWIDVIPPSESAAPKPAGEKKPAAAPKKADDLFDEPATAEAIKTDPPKPEPAKEAPPAAVEKPPSAPPKDEATKPAATKLFGGLPAKAAAAPADDKPADKPAEQKPAAAAPTTRLFGGLPKAAAAKPADKPAGDKPAAAPAKPALFGGLPAKAKVVTPPAAPQPVLKGVPVSLAAPLAAGSADLKAQTVEALQKRLLAAGLKPQEVERFLKYYGPALFEGEGVVVVCRLASAALEEKLPLSIFPEPAKIVRVPIVVMRNADPQLGSEVDRLVAQLGNAQYAERQAAQKRLTELGALAFARLQKALEDSDPEIVIRSERILLQQNQTPNPQAKPAAKAAVNGQFAPVAAPAIRFNAN